MPYDPRGSGLFPEPTWWNAPPGVLPGDPLEEPQEPENEDYPPECTCRLESVCSASLDPPERIRTRGCPVHWPIDPDRELQAQQDDAIDFPAPEIDDFVPF